MHIYICVSPSSNFSRRWEEKIRWRTMGGGAPTPGIITINMFMTSTFHNNNNNNNDNTNNNNYYYHD